jgi:hypothetical protein
MKNFEIALKKGNIGEDIVSKYLENKGWIIYRPFTKDKAHYFDMLCTYNKEKVIAIDVKTKARLNKWNAQGIDIRHYKEYLNFIEITKVNFYLIFVDDKTGEVHLAELSKLNNPIYPNKQIIAWNVNDMRYLFSISENDINNLSQYDQRSYKFKPVN